MKKIKLFSALIIALAFTACDKEDAIINNVYDGSQIGLGFTDTSAAAAVKEEGAVVTLGVQSTVATDTDRSYNVSVNSELSDGNAGHYSIGGITIPAGSYDGTLTVNMIDDGTLAEGIAYTLVLDLDLPDGVAVHTSSRATILYNKYQLCNDYTLTIVDDFWSSERTWDVADSSGAVVASGGPYANANGPTIHTENFTLADGCYTFTIRDSWGDGQVSDISGTYSLDCGISNAASGGGGWGFEEATDFCVNP